MTDFWQKAWEQRQQRRQPKYLKQEMAFRYALAAHGWYLVDEPEGNGGEAWVHIDDVETYIVGFLLNDAIVFDPGEDCVRLNRADFQSMDEFVHTMRAEFDKLVKEWY